MAVSRAPPSPTRPSRPLSLVNAPGCICRLLRFTQPFMHGACVLSDRPPTISWLINLRGVRVMLHNVASVNGKTDATTEYTPPGAGE